MRTDDENQRTQNKNPSPAAATTSYTSIYYHLKQDIYICVCVYVCVLFSSHDSALHRWSSIYVLGIIGHWSWLVQGAFVWFKRFYPSLLLPGFKPVSAQPKGVMPAP